MRLVDWLVDTVAILHCEMTWTARGHTAACKRAWRRRARSAQEREFEEAREAGTLIEAASMSEVIADLGALR